MWEVELDGAVSDRVVEQVGRRKKLSWTAAISKSKVIVGWTESFSGGERRGKMMMTISESVSDEKHTRFDT